MRGTITAFEGTTLSVKTQDQRDIKVDVPESVAVSATKAFRLSDVKPGMMLGVTTVKKPDGTVVAIDVRPISAAANQGLSPYDLQPESTMTNAAVEASVAATNGQELTLNYKTGTVNDHGSEAWLDAELFARLDACAPGEQDAAALLAELADRGLDVQLPLYLYLLAASWEWRPVNAAWVALKSDGAERPFFPDVGTEKQIGPEERGIVIQQRVPALVGFLLAHLLAAPEFPARSGRHCDWCDYQGPCCG